MYYTHVTVHCNWLFINSYGEIRLYSIFPLFVYK